MEDVIQRQILDRMEISDTVIRYATSIDLRDWSSLRSCFMDDIAVDVSSAGGPEPRLWKADEWVASIRGNLSGYQSTQHISTNHVITVNGDEASCLSYLQARHYLPNDKGDPFRTIGGHYDYDLVRTADGWKIRGYKLTITWAEGNWHLRELARQTSEE